ncbi:mannosylglycoprotein endo-beta-mannosidase-like isoform X3 [Castanea sativa]|uniref:mannosylglycoprotein endo-beta-mannosidase-like isoform X3 n=1 Tax=Castanea sativa TaxID=21020 RepID=UPI003F64FC8C
MPKGVFQRHSLNVTDILHPDGQNLLAFPVHLPDHPGRIPHKGEHGGDHEIGNDVATQYVLGWDWMAPKRDRNTGIWDEVSVSITRRVKIIDPHLVSSFFDDYKRVYLHATTELENRSAWVAECSLNIQVTIGVEGNICLVQHLQTQNLSFPAGSHMQYTFPEMEQQHLQHFCDSKHPLVYCQDYRGGDTCCGCQEPVYGPSYWFTRGGCPKYTHHKSCAELPLG